MTIIMVYGFGHVEAMEVAVGYFRRENGFFYHVGEVAGSARAERAAEHARELVFESVFRHGERE